MHLVKIDVWVQFFTDKLNDFFFNNNPQYPQMYYLCN